jgi:hypothetical protein
MTTGSGSTPRLPSDAEGDHGNPRELDKECSGARKESGKGDVAAIMPLTAINVRGDVVQKLQKYLDEYF